MTFLVNKLDSMTLNDNTSRKGLFCYICRVKKAKAHFLCEGGFIVIPSFDGKNTFFARWNVVQSVAFYALIVKIGPCMNI